MTNRETFLPVAVAAAKVQGIDPALFAAQIQTESGWNPEAQSGAGAIGIAQIVPRWHPSVNVRDPYASLQYAAKLMANYRAEFGSDDLALAAYNAGAGIVRQLHAVPDYPETRAYIRNIKALAATLAPEISTVSPSSPTDTGSTDDGIGSDPSKPAMMIGAFTLPTAVDRRMVAVAVAAIGLLFILSD